MYTGTTRNGIEFVFNNQTVLILLLLVKTVCGIDLLAFNIIVHCMQIPLIDCFTGEEIRLTCHLGMSHNSPVQVSGFTFALGFAFVTQDMIQCGVTWQSFLLCSHVIHVCMGLMSE